MDIIEKILSVMISLGILGQVLLLRRITGIWATPAGIFSLFWFVFSFVPLVALYYVPVNVLAITYIFFCCLSFSLSALVFNWSSALQVNAVNAISRVNYLNNSFMRLVFILSVLVSVLFIIIDLFIQGGSIGALIYNFFESSNEYLEMRYEGELKKNIFAQLGLVSAYICVTVGGILHAAETKKRKRNLILFMAFIPSIMIMLVQAAKGLFFLSIAIFMGANLLQRIVSNQHPFIDFIAIAKSSKFLILMVPLIIVSFLSRGLYESDDVDDVIQILIGYLASYAFMHIYAFSDWFSHAIGQISVMSYSREEISGGFYTFIALFQLSGSEKIAPPGVFEEYFFYGDLRPGNIYTIFRGLIQDFSIVGSLLFMFISGFLFNLSYYFLLKTQRPVMGLAVFMLLVNFIYTSYIISTLIWNSTYVVFFLMCVLFILNRYFYNNTDRY